MQKNAVPNYLLVILAVCFFGFAALLQSNVLWLRNSDKKIVAEFQQTLQEKEKKLHAFVDDLSEKAAHKNYQQLLNEHIDYYYNLLSTEGFALLIYEDDSLQFWSDNSIPVENYLKQICLDQPVEKLNNGWFRIIKQSKAGKTTLGLMLLKKEYPIHNRFLVDEFQPDFSVDPETQIVYGSAKDANRVLSADGTYLFTLKVQKDAEQPLRTSILLLLNFIGIFFLFLLIKQLVNSIDLKWGGNWAFVFLMSCLIFLRFICVYYNFPTVFYSLELFTPAIYANSIYIASLGDLFIHCTLLFIAARAFSLRIRLPLKEKFQHNSSRALFTGFLLLLLLVFSWYVVQLNISIIRDSKIPLNIENLLSLNGYSYLAFCSIGFLLMSFFLVADKICSAIASYSLPKATALLSAAVPLAALIVYAHFNGGKDLLITLWFLPVMLVIVHCRFIRKQEYNFSHSILFLLLFSAAIDYVFYKELGRKERDNRKLFAENLSEEKDPVAEFLFSDIEKKINKDKNLPRLLVHNNEGYASFLKSLTENYFSGYWEKYEVKFIVYDSLCNVLVKSNNSVNDKLDHYEEIVEKSGLPTTSKSLFYFPVNQDENAGLLAKLKFQVPQKNFSNPATLYIELLPKFITEEIGYPQLLLDKALVPRHDEEAYSFAKYKDHSFVPLQRVGKYKYPMNSEVFDTLSSGSDFISLNAYSHYLYRFNNQDSGLIVVSKEPLLLINRLTIFSYFFTIFSIMILIYFSVFQWNMRFADIGNKFKSRIQFVLVAVVLIAILLIGVSTIIFLKREYKSKNLLSLSEKIHSVYAELSHEIGDELSLNFSSNQYLNYVLSKQSNVFYSDINFYDLSGNLIASSRPQIFEQGLVSQKINPVAFYQLKVAKQFEFTHNEKIGELNFLSCYMPFISNNNQLLGYLNLPYFNKQNELENEISSVLVALINVYVLLFVLSIIVAVIISNRIMEPLKILQNKIGHLRLGKSNELIEWKNKDEIGELITEYNRMIIELSQSAELLAQSERESAWREMAKQVAHEIKNPLTPMKLSAQHLLRSYKDGAADWDKRVEKFTHTLIEQIDALSNIANEFSNFAKMPATSMEHIRLTHLVNSVVSLYQNSDEYQVSINFNNCEATKVKADKDQLIRLFNNLIKNAIQAIPDGQKGNISIDFFTEGKMLKVTVSDNGKGISEEQKDSIFKPNFTTKSGGMGLGLAMSKNIIENCKGSISFISEPGVGTTFTLLFPIVEV